MNKLSSLFTLLLLFVVHQFGWSQTTAMSYNIRYDNQGDGENWWEYRKEEVVNLLQYYYADFIGIQEALPHQYEFIAQQLTDYAHFGYGRDGEETNSEAVPLFYNQTKWKLLKYEQFWLSETPNVISIGWDAALNRIAVFGQFQHVKTGEILYVVNTHFDHQGERARRESAKLLLKYIKQKGLGKQKVIVMGDFNGEPNNEPIQLLSKKLNDSYIASKQEPYGPVGTFSGFDTNKVLTNRIDYIFTKNSNVLSYRVIDDRRENHLYPSDHLPVYIKIK